VLDSRIVVLECRPGVGLWAGGIAYFGAVELVAKPLDAGTWPDFVRLAEDHSGVWAGCWCLGFHDEGKPREHTPQERRELKATRVRQGRAHAALVYDGELCVGWCQFGPPRELPRIKYQKAYREGMTALPDWRITCFFVARGYRGQGVADAALAGAVTEIGRLGGGLVESYPEETDGRKVSGSLLYNATVALFERHGFQRVRPIGKHHWVVSRRVS
jgi:GNAT superfamily N-acetyltransferase